MRNVTAFVAFTTRYVDVDEALKSSKNLPFALRPMPLGPKVLISKPPEMSSMSASSLEDWTRRMETECVAPQLMTTPSTARVARVFDVLSKPRARIVAFSSSRCMMSGGTRRSCRSSSRRGVTRVSSAACAREGSCEGVDGVEDGSHALATRREARENIAVAAEVAKEKREAPREAVVLSWTRPPLGLFCGRPSRALSLVLPRSAEQ